MEIRISRCQRSGPRAPRSVESDLRDPLPPTGLLHGREDVNVPLAPTEVIEPVRTPEAAVVFSIRDGSLHNPR